VSVRRTVPSFRFTPARAQGQRVAQRVRVPFEFAIER
jgi:outer membrane biosynthesis protein TonB